MRSLCSGLVRANTLERRTASASSVASMASSPAPVTACGSSARRSWRAIAAAVAAQRLRFLNFVQAPGGTLVHFFTHIDYDRHMAFVCEAAGGALVGEARYVANADGRSCEFGIVVADGWRHSGVARLLRDALIRAAQARKLETMAGLVLSENHDMLHFARALGFDLGPDPARPGLVRVTRKL